MADRTDIRPTPDAYLSGDERTLVARDATHGEIRPAAHAPGGIASPQVPGARPDRSSIPGHGELPVPPATSIQRPLTQYGTSQEIMGVFAPKPGEAMDPARFEQATASWEEIRKAYPALSTPRRPAPGYALQTGDAVASEAQEIGGPDPAALAPEAGRENASVLADEVSPADPTTPGQSSDPGRSASEVMRGFTMGSGRAGTSRWQDASPAPGDARSPAGTLPSAEPENGPADDRGDGAPPSIAPS
jgi:hypothetical protein